MLVRLLTAIFVSLLLVGCVSPTPSPYSAQPKKLDEIQKRIFPTKGNCIPVIRAIIHTLQAGKFTIVNADKELGMITAKKEERATAVGRKALAWLTGRAHEYTHVIASVSVSKTGSKCLVYVNFIEKRYDTTNTLMGEQTIVDPKYYDKFFEMLKAKILGQ